MDRPTWIITKGYYCGVHKAVGDAVREAMNSNKGRERDQIYCIGIGPWGYVENSKSLVGKKEEGLYPAQYKVNPIVVRKKTISLDPHHTHFLLVDDGTIESYGYDIPFRAKLEKEMTEPTKGGPTDSKPTERGPTDSTPNKTGAIPVVKICLGGGEDTIKSAKVAVENQIPVVFCEGTGRAADLLAEACKNCVLDNGVRKINPSERDNVHKRMENVCEIRDDDTKNYLKEAIDFIMRHETMITVFRMDGGEQAGLDLAILKALLKGKAAKPERQLELARSWGRADVAKSIFEGNNEWKPESYDEFVTNALKENQVDFLKLFLEKGVIMKEYLTDIKLSGLYKEEKDVLFQNFGELGSFNHVKDSFILRKVSSIIRSLTGADHYDYSISTHWLSGKRSTFDDVQSKRSTNGSLEFKHPFTELFLWAILGSRMDLAEFLWERSENPVCLAIVALRMISSMSKKDKDKRTFLEESASNFEKLAIDVLEECFRTDTELAQRMIKTPHKLWSGMSTLKIAADSKSKEFISHPCTQAVLDNTWKGSIQSAWWKVVLALILPPLVVLLISYKEKKNASASILDKFGMFYRAPVAKFYGGVILYALLLLLFSYVLIFNFEPRPSFLESVLFGWICTLIIEEIRQMVIPNSFEIWNNKKIGLYHGPVINIILSIGHCLYQWVRSCWNCVDAAMLILAVVGYVLHWTWTRESAKGFFSASCFLFYVRLLRIYAVNGRLGPKMVMIRKMIWELLLFLCILLVFMIGYGVAIQSLLYPNERNVGEAITGVFYMPYFQILGELFLDVAIEGKLEDCSSNNTDNNLHLCPETGHMVSILFVIYLLIGNVMLLNLLIAIFSFVFDEIQSKSEKIWKYERYALVMEYADKSTLAAPFNVFEHIYVAIKWLYRKSCGKKNSANDSSYETNDELKIFEKECAARYRWKKAKLKNVEVSEKVDRIEKKLEELLKKT